MITGCRRYFFVLLVLLVSQLAGCSSTQIKSVWKDHSYIGKPQRVMVVSVSREPIYRRIFEDEFVLQLKARGTDAIASYVFLPDKNQDDQAVISKVMAQWDADTVLITRLVSKRSIRTYYPSQVTHRPLHYRKWPEFYRLGYEALGTPVYSTQYDYALMETNLYDALNDNLLWAATTETGVENLNQALIKPYIGTILNLMVDYGVLRK